MRTGSKSLLFGAHCFVIHPWFVMAAWWRLYGFPRHPLLWLCFLVHDWGYWGKKSMDDEEGEKHVELGARILGLFGPKWHDFCLYHSRFYAMKNGRHYSPLCVADKLAIVLTPAWLYIPMARASGEIAEYLELSRTRTIAGEPKYRSMKLTTTTEQRWYADVQRYLELWVEEHKGGQDDTWTPKL